MHAVARDWQRAPLDDAERALCQFAADLTHRQSTMNTGDLDQLRAHGFDDRAIHDAVQVVAYFNYITRIAHALGVEQEDFIQSWGSTE